MGFTRRDFVDRALKGSVLALSFEMGGASLVADAETGQSPGCAAEQSG